MENKIPFYRKINTVGGSLMIGLPSEIANYLNFKKEDTLTIIVDTNKKGQKFMAVYKNENNSKEN